MLRFRWGNATEIQATILSQQEVNRFYDALDLIEENWRETANEIKPLVAQGEAGQAEAISVLENFLSFNWNNNLVDMREVYEKKLPSVWWRSSETILDSPSGPFGFFKYQPRHMYPRDRNMIQAFLASQQDCDSLLEGLRNDEESIETTVVKTDRSVKSLHEQVTRWFDNAYCSDGGIGPSREKFSGTDDLLDKIAGKKLPAPAQQTTAAPSIADSLREVRGSKESPMNLSRLDLVPRFQQPARDGIGGR